MKKILFIVSILLFAFFFSCSDSFEQNLELQDSSNGFYGKVDSIVIAKMIEYNVPGLSIGLVKNDSIIYTKGYGVKRIGTDNLVSKNSIFHTASISKLFTAMAVMQLVDKEIIALNDRLINVLPELEFSDEEAKNITIKNLLDHTSGLPDINDYQWENNNQSENGLKKYILGLNLKVSSAPSSEYNYSNLGYDILGYVVEKKSGTVFEDYIKDNILDPSGMDNSDFRYFKISDSLKTSPHSKRWITKQIYSRNTYPYTREHSPSSTLNSSSRDLGKWMVYFLRMINNESSPSMYNSMLEPSFESNSHMGLGFQLFDFKSYKAAGHFGGDKGFRSFLMIIPGKNLGLVVLGNSDYEEDYRQEIIYPIAELMLTENESF